MSTFNELIDFTRSTTGTYLDSVVYGDELVTNGDFNDGLRDGQRHINLPYQLLSNAMRNIYKRNLMQHRTLLLKLGKKYVVTFERTCRSAGRLVFFGVRRLLKLI